MIKNILVANNFLEKLGGSETFTYSLIEELIRKGYSVEYFTFYKGEISDKIEKDLNISFMSRKKYDLILANHYSCVWYLSSRGKTIQTCHGIFPELEQPSRFADGHVGISQEVVNHIHKKGFEAQLILNGINCKRFKPTKEINEKLKNVLSLCQSEAANNVISEVCKQLNLNVDFLNKYDNPIWNVENKINEADLVVGLGRSAYEAMACGRTVVIYDNRDYFKTFSDGYVHKEMLPRSILHNCSGRAYKKELSIKELIEEFKQYTKNDGLYLRNFALEHLNIENQVNAYINYAETIEKKFNLFSFIFKSYQKIKVDNKKRRRKRKAKKST